MTANPDPKPKYRKTHCPRGHSLEDAYKNKLGYRTCRICAKTPRGVKHTCSHCGKDYERWPSARPIKGKKTFCSNECRILGGGYGDIAEKMRERAGENNPNYRTGKRTGATIRGWSCAKKGEYRCRNCGSMERLSLHHAIPRRTCSALREDLRNGLPLCGSCHSKWHRSSLVLYRDIFTQEEWDVLSKADLVDRVTSTWLDKHYPDRGLPFRRNPEREEF